jgi:hypothetical protein
MRWFPAALVLVGATTLAGCGGDSNPAAGHPPGVLNLWSPSDGRPAQTASVTFTAAEGSSGPSQASAYMDWTSDVYVTTSQTGPMFSHWLNDHGTNGNLVIAPAWPAQAGTFVGTITINGCSRATLGACDHVVNSPKTINVTYTVLGVSVTPQQLTFSSTGTNPQSQTATLTASAGAPAYTWEVSYSPSGATWLEVVPSGGTADLSAGAQALQFNVNAAGLAAGVYSATVRFTTASNYSVRVPVTLIVGSPSVNFVSPYVVPAGSGGNVIIRGRGFSALNPDGLAVQFNSTPATSATIVSDTEIRASYPALAAGSYAISVSSGGTSIPSRAALKLAVIAPRTSVLTTIARPASAGPPASLIYDAERNALLFTDASNGRVLRYALSGSGDAAADFSSVGRLALSPDGTELIKATYAQLVRLDPVTLAVLSSVDLRASLSGRSLAFANDGGLIGACSLIEGGTLCRYDMLAQAVSALSFQSHMGTRHAFASADGNTVVLAYFSSDAADSRVYVYDASSGALSARSPTTIASFPQTYAGAGSTSANGSPTILYNAGSPTRIALYDAQFNVLGALPDGAAPFVISPDGSSAYAYNAAGGSVLKFGISGGGAAETGRSVVAPPGTQMTEMTISPDGGTLFLAGTTSVVIAPAP